MKSPAIIAGLCALLAVHSAAEGLATVFKREEELMSFAPHHAGEVSFADRRAPCTSWGSTRKPNMAIMNTPYKTVLSSCSKQCGRQCANDPQCTAFTFGLSNEGDLACWFYAVKNASRIKWKPSTVYTSGSLTCSAPQASAAAAAQTDRPSSTLARPPNAGIETPVTKATAGATKLEGLRASSTGVSVSK